MSRVTLASTDPSQARVDLLVVPLFEGEAARGAIDSLAGGAARAAIGRDFKGKARETLLLYPKEGAKPTRLLLVGLGKRDKATVESARKAAGAAVVQAHKLKAKTIAFALSGGDVETALAESPAAFAEATILADYKFEHHKSEPDDDGEKDGARKEKKKREPLQITVLTKHAKQAKDTLDRAVLVAEAANAARDLANQPANFGTPTHLAETAKRIGKESGFKVKVLDRAECEKLGMGSFMGVARGSEEPPRFIVMEHEPPAKAGKKVDTVAVIGKGITFDSGGISIKPADKMWEMKYDKSGGCATIGIMSAVARAKLPIRVIGLVPATENLPSGRAIKPGDVVTAMNGKTIEVQNTDAEGRLILADALAYSARYTPSSIVDMATLTGACVIALGEIRAGLFSTDEGLAAELKSAGESVGELVWHMPLDEAYAEALKSDAADLKNIGGRSAGAVTAACFLKNFAPKGARWAHLDIAGTAWGDNKHRGYIGAGSSGFGVRLVFEWLRRLSDTHK